MSLTEADFRKWEKDNSPEADKEKIEQATQKKMVGSAMSQVKSDPRWKVYADHLIQLRGHLEERVELLAREILEDNTVDIIAKKMERKTLSGRIGGFSDAISFIEVLIDQGENAAKFLTESETTEEENNVGNS